MAGTWDTPRDFGPDFFNPARTPIRVIHLMHLHTGKFLAFSYGLSQEWPEPASTSEPWKYRLNSFSTPEARLWTPPAPGAPATDRGLFELVPNHRTNLFCAGHCPLHDGRVFLAGGHFNPMPTVTADPQAADEVFYFPPLTSDLFLPARESWRAGPDMRHKRWYPTCTRMWDRRVLISLGDRRTPPLDITGRALRCEVFDPATDALTELAHNLPVTVGVTYVFVYCVPTSSGPRMLYAGPEPQAYVWDGNAGSPWSAFGSPITGQNGLYASTSVMYAPGKVLKVGGSPSGTPPALNFMWRLDTTTGAGWLRTNTNLRYARMDATGVMMPDQKVLIVGGKDGPTPRLIGEIYDPIADTTTVDTLPMQNIREYHSVAMLLKDARVMVGGGEGAPLTFQIYNPPYFSLNQDTRPVITAAPAQIVVPQPGGPPGAAFRVNWQPQAAGNWRAISKVCLIALGAVTHGFDQNQRYVPLEFEDAGQGALDVFTPIDTTHAPPGWYMLFLVTEDGLPSVAVYIQVV
ncbi:MAG: DUF1929 domain-containing protein [Phycisphaerae bacterium]|nr:DUF1929 domain-containing protein [Phycisphaerae bacterium]